MPFKLTREQLYDLVWSEPKWLLSKKIGISDVAIAKHCRKVGIPVPERGYWNKLHAGKRVSKASLAERDLGTVNLISMSGTLPADLCARIKGEPGVYDEEGCTIDLLTERFRKRLGKVTVPRDFSRAHPAVAALLEQDEKSREEYAKHPYSWNQPRFDGPFERRRLLFLNGLFLAFAKVGGTPSTHGNNALQELSIHIGGNSVGIKLDKAGPERMRGSAAANGAYKLCLTLASYDIPPGVTAQWEDREGSRLESQLTDIVVGIAVAGERLHRHWLEKQVAWERQRREEAEREAIRRKQEAERRERERLAAIEKAKIDALLQEARNWRQANNIRDYVRAALTAKDRVADGDLDSWSQWALAEADRLDPLASGRCAQRERL